MFGELLSLGIEYNLNMFHAVYISFFFLSDCKSCPKSHFKEDPAVDVMGGEINVLFLWFLRNKRWTGFGPMLIVMDHTIDVHCSHCYSTLILRLFFSS